MPPSHIAVLGGGFTGLSSAFYLSRRFPSALITLVEANSRLGGWAHGERVSVKVDDNGASASMLLEFGPRTLRPNGKPVLELINLLKLRDSVITVPRTAAPARNRFLHVPGTDGLLRLPSSPLDFINPKSTTLSYPLRSLLLKSDMPLLDSFGTEYDHDESLDHFLTRRFGDHFARLLGSALVHGIYAADARKLSVRAAFPRLWELEEYGMGSVIRGYLTHSSSPSNSTYDIGSEQESMRDAAVFSFKDGMATLPAALEARLTKTQNVRIRKNVKVRVVSDADSTVLEPSHIVSALPLPILSNVLDPSIALPHLNANPASDITVVNLVFPRRSPPLHPAGFGYLIPRPASGYDSAENPAGILGVVFDSCALWEQDEGDSASFIKMTVMFGGPYTVSPTAVSTETLLKELARHLGARNGLPEPVFVHTQHLKSCIPTLTPGHLDRMAQLRHVLRPDGPFSGRLEVIGAGVGGVSVPGCIEAGRQAGSSW
ncbi:Protoporphyrinogen oxidase [Fistulina hepatica ATCC 64428]|uniref:Protoporphyrinogen oxidase n=1 Tax=Fistulina hepatica ATCC 64428 TaxID=1128425 RepID=A0A0D7ANI0_9AGAR|nr:Protoporphyrinogen oxidase [Fistulina hepatica ATCC 64428]